MMQADTYPVASTRVSPTRSHVSGPGECSTRAEGKQPGITLLRCLVFLLFLLSPGVSLGEEEPVRVMAWTFGSPLNHRDMDPLGEDLWPPENSESPPPVIKNASRFMRPALGTFRPRFVEPERLSELQSVIPGRWVDLRSVFNGLPEVNLSERAFLYHHEDTSTLVSRMPTESWVGIVPVLENVMPRSQLRIRMQAALVQKATSREAEGSVIEAIEFQGESGVRSRISRVSEDEMSWWILIAPIVGPDGATIQLDLELKLEIAGTRYEFFNRFLTVSLEEVEIMIGEGNEPGTQLVFRLVPEIEEITRLQPAFETEEERLELQQRFNEVLGD